MWHFSDTPEKAGENQQRGARVGMHCNGDDRDHGLRVEEKVSSGRRSSCVCPRWEGSMHLKNLRKCVASAQCARGEVARIDTEEISQQLSSRAWEASSGLYALG